VKQKIAVDVKDRCVTMRVLDMSQISVMIGNLLERFELLNQYYAANLLLVEYINRSYVRKQVREEIESTMLLPSKK
jgi:hypothetical protein